MNKLLGFLRAIFGFDQDDAEELMELLADFPGEDFNTVTMERDNRLALRSNRRLQEAAGIQASADAFFHSKVNALMKKAIEK